MARRPARDGDDDRYETPPWMERDPAPPRRSPRAAAREPEPTHTLVSWRALVIGAVLALLAAVGLIWGVRTLIRREPGAGTAANAPGEVPLIRAPAGPYKIKPVDAGGAQLAGAGDPATSAGNDPIGAIIDTGAAPETPQRPAAAPAPAPTDILPRGQDAEAGDAQAANPDGEAQPAPVPVPVPVTPPAVIAARPTFRQRSAPVVVAADTPAPKPKPKPLAAKPKPVPAEIASAEHFKLPPDFGASARPTPKPAAASGSLQLGAFSTREKAEAAWARYAAAFPEVAALHERIAPLARDGQTLYRLRAGGAGARATAICAKLKAAGEACIVSP